MLFRSATAAPIVLKSGRLMRRWSSGWAPAFQAGDAGSTPVLRSPQFAKEKHFMSEVLPTLISRTLDEYPLSPWTAENLSVQISKFIRMWNPANEQEILDSFDWVGDKQLMRDALKLAVDNKMISQQILYYMTKEQRKNVISLKKINE